MHNGHPEGPRRGRDRAKWDGYTTRSLRSAVTTRRVRDGNEISPHAEDEGAPDTREQLRYARRALSVVVLASILMGLNNSTLNVALPEIARHFHAGSVASSWVLLSFQLGQSVLLLIFGRLTDMSGRRVMYLAGLSTFIVVSVALGFSPTVWVLIGLRVLQAAGSAMLLTNSGAIITDAFPRRLLGHGMGLYIASFSVAQLLGPSLGGFIAASAGWQWVFWFNVPVGVVALVWGAYSLREMPTGQRPKGLDLRGNLALVLALAGLLVALSEVGQLSWVSPVVVGGFVVFAVLVPVFVLIERRQTYPVVDLSFFLRPVLSMPYFAGFANSATRFSILVALALYFQSVGGDDTFSAGLKVLPLAMATMVASALLGVWTRRIEARSVAIIGMSITLVGLLILYPALSVAPQYTSILAGLVLVGFGSGTFQPANTTGIMEAVPSGIVGSANATRLVAQNVGTVFGTAMTLTLVSALLASGAQKAVFSGTLSQVAKTSLAPLIVGYHYALIFFIAICALGLIATVLSRNSIRRSRAQEL